MTKDNKLSTKTIALIGVMTAVICILGPLSVPLPFSPVPLSLTTFALYLAIYVLGTKMSLICYFLYLLIGFVGVPVFSSFSAGPAKLLGPTGGYLIGFFFLVLSSGIFIEKWPDKKALHLVGMIIGNLICYLFGTAWLAYQAGLDFKSALWAGVIPFIPGDLIKIILALLIGSQIHKKLRTIL